MTRAYHCFGEIVNDRTHLSVKMSIYYKTVPGGSNLIGECVPALLSPDAVTGKQPNMISQANNDSTPGINPLQRELDAKRSEIQRCYLMLESLMKQHDAAFSEIDKLKQSLAVSLEDNRYLWDEIGKLRHGYEGVSELKIFYQTELSELRKYTQTLIEQIRNLNIEGVQPVDPPPQQITPVLGAYHSTYTPDSKLRTKFYCGLDVPESHLNWDAGEMIHVGGWCFDSEGRIPRRIWVLVGEQEIPCSLGWKREDVVKAFEEQIRADLRCGFNVEISAGPGINFISVYAEFCNGAEVCIFRRTILRLGSGEIRMGQLDQNYESWIGLFDSLNGLRKNL
jgi:hypothetical protein